MSWYWCILHDTVEPEQGCPAHLRLGPYESPEAAQNWRERTEARDNRWEDEDARWEGRPPEYWPR
jgi:hypothetical protein